MPANNNWYSCYSTFEEDRGGPTTVLAQGRDPRFFDDQQPVFSRDLILSRMESIPGFHICDWGEDRWPPGRSVRNRNCDQMPVLHFVIDGKGTLNGSPVAAGCAFVINPSIPYSMTSDTEAPLRYCWIRIRDADAFFRSLGIFTYGEDGCGRFDFSDCLEDVIRLFRKGLRISGSGQAMFLGLNSLFFEIMSRCLRTVPVGETLSPYVKSALEIIRENYSSDINVNTLAEQLHISRNHLRRLFLRDLGITPKDQITRCRMDVAATLMDTKPSMTFAQIAAEVGYPSYSQFIHAFRGIHGCTPGEYRKTEK